MLLGKVLSPKVGLGNILIKYIVLNLSYLLLIIMFYAFMSAVS